MKYGYAEYVDAERWRNGEESIVATIAEAIGALHGGEHLPVAICEVTPPEINYGWLAQSVIEQAEEQLCEEVGEVADTFEPTNEQRDELAAAIQAWVVKHGLICCWKAENGRMYAPGAPEYDAATAKVNA
jgi:hypothetical protein